MTSLASLLICATFFAVKLSILIPLAILMGFVVVVIPAAAWRGKLSVPVYSFISMAAALVALAAGKLAGAPSIRKTTLGFVVAFVFFLLVATAAGSFFALLFYRHRPQEPVHSEKNQDK